MQCLDIDSLPAQAWRNGGGATREVLAWPAGPDWRVRLSVADIDRDGPFSPFPGVQRHFAVLSGGGVALRWADGPWRPQQVGQAPCVFDGAEGPDCRLLAGPTRDLNLMLRGVAGCLLQADDQPWAADWPWRALVAWDAARLSTADGQRLELPARSAVVALPPGPVRVQSTGLAFWLGAAQAVEMGA
ncbi:HutD/Ves family protein [Inhella gelatinilytica]|uniref:HutD family protein n=1 Tax=Inhella gelatinilytica TaxID=2795030 RepID=A0A931IY66_9BURK|nr:HutD family protein [Inhella gelatinilytica]MBH9552001.1 HutD family protein [Inhella gelatinilytica]